MKKLRLDLEELKVETFETERVDLEPGTVRAHNATQKTDCLCGETYDDLLCGGITWGCSGLPGC